MNWPHAVHPAQTSKNWRDLATPDRPVRVVVPYTDPATTRAALAAVATMTEGLAATIVLLAVHVLPYPAPFYCPRAVREHLEGELTALARTLPGPVEAILALARTPEEGYSQILPPGSAVFIGTPRRWFRTREQRLANLLTGLGHSVALVELPKEGRRCA